MAVTEDFLGPGHPSLESGEELRHGHREAGQGKVWDSEKKNMNIKQDLLKLQLVTRFLQSSDLATLGRRTAAIETLVSQLREAAEASETTNRQQDAGKGIFKGHD